MLLADAWTADSTDAIAGCTSTALLLETANDPYYSRTGYRVFEGACPLTDPDNVYGCYWNNSMQAFLGPRCVQSTQLNCMCTHFTDFTARVGPSPLIYYTATDSLDSGSSTVNAILILALLIALVGALLAGVAFLWNRRKRAALLARLQGAGCGFQSLSSGAWTWEWSVDLSNPGEGPGPALSAAIGIPWSRLHAALPDAGSLGMGPPSGSAVRGELGDGFKARALGTALVHAWLGLSGALPASELGRQGELANAAFEGCHPLGFAALVDRFRAMLAPGGCSLLADGWLPRAALWRLIFSQGSGGLWSSGAQAEAVAQALGAIPMPPFSAGASEEAHGEVADRAMDRAPPELRALADRNGPSLWLSVCAMVQLQQAGEGWVEASATADGFLSPEELAKRGLVAALSRLGPVGADGSMQPGQQPAAADSAASQASTLLDVRIEYAVL
jgi:hypothetical protein